MKASFSICQLAKVKEVSQEMHCDHWSVHETICFGGLLLVFCWCFCAGSLAAGVRVGSFPRCHGAELSSRLVGMPGSQRLGDPGCHVERHHALENGAGP